MPVIAYYVKFTEGCTLYSALRKVKTFYAKCLTYNPFSPIRSVQSGRFKKPFPAVITMLPDELLV